MSFVRFRRMVGEAGVAGRGGGWKDSGKDVMVNPAHIAEAASIVPGVTRFSFVGDREHVVYVKGDLKTVVAALPGGFSETE